MSNNTIKDHKAFDEIESYLSEKDTRLISVIDKDNNITLLFPNNIGGKSRTIGLDGINTHYGSVFQLFEKLYQKEYKNVKVLLRKKNGSSSTPSDHPDILIKLSSMLQTGDKKVEDFKNAPLPFSPEKPSVMNTHTPSQDENSSQNFFGGLGQAANMAGLGVVDLIELKTNNNLYKKLLVDYDELKARAAGNESKYKLDIAELELKIRTLESQMSTAEKEKELALKTQALEQKSVFETPVAQEISKGIPQFLQIMMSKGQAVPVAPEVGLASADNVSDAKAQLIEYIKSDEVSDDVASNFISYVIYHMANTPSFSEELQSLIDRTQ